MYTDRKGSPMLQQTSDDQALRTLGGRLRAVRKARGLRIGAVASQIELSRTSLSQWEADAVKNPDVNKLGKFARLMDISLDWLLELKGDDPDLTMPPPTNRRRLSGSSAERPAGAEKRVPHLGLPIPEISPSLVAHASQVDRAPRTLWTIPHQVLEIGFNAEPGATVVQRIVTRSGEFGLARGDYILIDLSRTRIDEAGIYLIADPEGTSASRALIVEKDGKLEVAAFADDLQRDHAQASVDTLIPLGRIMGIFKPS